MIILVSVINKSTKTVKSSMFQLVFHSQEKPDLSMKVHFFITKKISCNVDVLEL